MPPGHRPKSRALKRSYNRLRRNDAADSCSSFQAGRKHCVLSAATLQQWDARRDRPTPTHFLTVLAARALSLLSFSAILVP